MAVAVTGMAIASAIGGVPQAWKTLLNGDSGILIRQPFELVPPRPLGLIGDRPAHLVSLTRQLVTAALADAKLLAPLPECAVVVGSSRGQQAQWESLAAQYRANPQDQNPSGLGQWLETWGQSAAVTAAQTIGTQGAVRSPMAACATGLWAIAQGAALIQSGDCEQVIVGAVETPITPLTLVGFERMGALAITGAYPFDRDREGLVLGEGGAIFVLEKADLARQRHAPIYGYITGWGLTADGYHVSAPDPGQTGAIAAVQQCLSRGGLRPAAIDYIHAHGTATQLNDHNEARLIQHLFPPTVWVSSTKGATGHTIGASGALGVAFSLLALRDQLLPPSVGLRDPAFDLKFVTTAQPATVDHALCLSFGFGGQNAAIALQREPRAATYLGWG